MSWKIDMVIKRMPVLQSMYKLGIQSNSYWFFWTLIGAHVKYQNR